MRVLWSIHLYPPGHNCGSEWMAHHINKFLIAQGHECRVVLHMAGMHNITVPYTFEGVEVFGPPNTAQAYQWADIILSHLDYAHYTLNMADVVGRPFVFFAHNSTKYECVNNARRNVNVVYNSEWIRKETLYPQWPGMVLPPPCYTEHYRATSQPDAGKYITLISSSENKGGKQFIEIARRMPGRQFLIVKGSYDEQITASLLNLTIMDNTADIRPVYANTRILLMPSKYESWGRTATEAMCNGIPVIANPTPGLRENCGIAGIFVDRDDINGWVEAIELLDDRGYYREVSQLCLTRAEELNPTDKLYELQHFLRTAVESYHR
jgi:glycosyltransferase involved in cell wall biosynthesis